MLPATVVKSPRILITLMSWCISSVLRSLSAKRTGGDISQERERAVSKTTVYEIHSFLLGATLL